MERKPCRVCSRLSTSPSASPGMIPSTKGALVGAVHSFAEKNFTKDPAKVGTCLSSTQP